MGDQFDATTDGVAQAIEELKQRQRDSEQQRPPGAPGPGEPGDFRTEFQITGGGAEHEPGISSTRFRAKIPFFVDTISIGLGTSIGSDVVWELRRNGDQIAAVTIAAGQTESPTVPVGVIYGAIREDILTVVLTDDGGGGWDDFDVNITARR